MKIENAQFHGLFYCYVDFLLQPYLNVNQLLVNFVYNKVCDTL